MNFAGVQSVTIPEGDVKSIAIGGVTVWTKPNPLPYDAEVEYLESTGTQYVDTGLTTFADFEATVQLRSNVVNKTLGVAATSCIQRVSSGNPFWQFSSNNRNYNSTARITDRHTLKWAANQIWIDGSFVANHTKEASSGRLTIARVGTTNYTGVIIYSAKFFDGSTLVRSFVPVRIGTVGYLFDRVSGTLFGNAGTGSFVLGPDKNGG